MIKKRHCNRILWTLFISMFALAALSVCGSARAEKEIPDGELGRVEHSAPLATNWDPVSAALAEERWSPYICGLGIGLLCWLTFLLSNRPLGISTAYAKTAGMLEKLRRGDQVERMDYYKKFPPKIGWEWVLVIGVIIGACISASMSGSFDFVFLPETWRSHFGDTHLLRWLIALGGGVLMGIGARWAGGCTSGHGISGTLQLAVSSWVVVIAMFAGGIVTAFMIM